LIGPLQKKKLKLWRLPKIEHSIERWSASPLPYYLGSFDTNYIIIFKDVKNLKFFFSPITKFAKENVKSSRIFSLSK
jgi:hypothetical protein